MIGLVVKYGTAVDTTVVNVVVATWHERESGSGHEKTWLINEMKIKSVVGKE
jgi:hypothetical protein